MNKLHLEMSREDVVYAFIHRNLKLFYVGNSNTLGQGILNVMSHLETKPYAKMKQLWDELDVIVMQENVENAKLRKHLTFVEMSKLKDDGYTEIISSNITNYSILKVVCELGEVYNASTLYWCVNIIDRNRTRILLGVFEKEDEAKEWMNKHYSNGTVGDNMVFADNALTASLKRKHNIIE